MHPSTILAALTLISTVISAPTLSTRQTPCFIVGSTALPAEVQDVVTAIQSAITCGSATTISGVPDVTSGDLHHSPQNDLTTFQDELNTYLATEAGIRSVGGSLAIKVPKFFLAFQVARIKTAQGTAITGPGQTVEHLLGKVTKNAAGESQDLLDQVTALASVLS